MFKIENFIDLNEEILSTNGPIQLTEQKNIVDYQARSHLNKNYQTFCGT